MFYSKIHHSIVFRDYRGLVNKAISTLIKYIKIMHVSSKLWTLVGENRTDQFVWQSEESLSRHGDSVPTSTTRLSDHMNSTIM